MIGVFDSGFGGLSIFKYIEKQLPQYDYIYLGDNARAPYGDLDQEVVYAYVKQAVDYLFAQGCNLIILACNTASAEALRKIQQEYLPSKYLGKNVIGVIRPLAEEAARVSKNKIVGVMGTNNTVDSRAYIRELRDQDGALTIYQQACPLLVPIVEASDEKSKDTQDLLERYSESLQSYNPDTVILGCTHYGFLRNQFQKIFGPEVNILESGKIVADKLESYLANHPNFAQPSKKFVRTFLTTGDTKKFDKAAEKFFGKKIKSQKIKLA